MNRRITLSLLLSVLAAALLIAGCGSSSEETTSSSSDAPTDVPEFSEIAPDVNTAMSGASSASFTLDMQADVSASSGSQLDALTQEPISVKLSGAASETAVDVDLDASGSGKQFIMQLIGDETASYLKFKDVWYDLGEPLDLNTDVPDVSSLDAGAEESASETPEVDSASPEAIQAQLDKYGIEVSGEGSTTSDGSPTYKYTFVFTDPASLAQAIQESDPETGPLEAKAIAAVLTSPEFEMSASVYADSSELAGFSFALSLSKDQLAQISGESDSSLGESGFESLDLSIDSEFSNWNQPVSIEKPSGDVRSVDELQQALLPELFSLGVQRAAGEPTEVPPTTTTP